jgi:hypothetical protein
VGADIWNDLWFSIFGFFNFFFDKERFNASSISRFALRRRTELLVNFPMNLLAFF